MKRSTPRATAQVVEFASALHRSIAPVLEGLESRRLLSTSVWTGAGTNNDFSNGANWQGGVAPASGDDIVFGDVGSAQTVDVDTNAIVGNIYSAGNYTITGNELGINGNIETEANSTLTFSNTIEPAATAHFTSDAGATLTLNAIDDSTSSTFDEYGDGTLIINGASSANWQILAGTMELNAQNSMNLTQYAGTLKPICQNGTLVNSYTQNGGTLDVTTPLTNGEDSLGANQDVNLNSGTVIFLINAGGNISDVTSSSNTVPLAIGNGEQVQLVKDGSFTPTIGNVFYPLYSTAGSGPVGTFANTSNGNLDQLNTRLAVGSQYNYYTLTVLGQYPTVALTPSTTSATVGTAVTLSAAVSTSGGSTPTGTVTFSDNGTSLGTGTVTNGVATLTVPSFTAGSHPITATYGGDSNYLTEASSAVTVTSTAAVTPPSTTGPTVTTPATGSVSTAKAATLSVGTTDTSSSLSSGVTYTWSIVRLPSGAKNPTFSVNSTHAAATTMATFSKDGTYHLRVTATDANGHSTTSDVDYVVRQKARGLRLSPHAFKIEAGHSQHITTVALDQFSHPMRVVATPTYSVTTGSGSVSSSGVFTAGSVFGHVIIQSTLDGLTGVVGATVV